MGPFADPVALAAAARAAEARGYDSIWVGDHLVLPRPQAPPSPLAPDHPIIEPVTALAYLAGVTDSILLGTGIVILPQRHPVVLAKQASAIDNLSAGRLLLGLGAGYLEPELTAAGVTLAERGARTDEYLAAMRTLWSEDPASFDGRYVSFSEVASYPRPVRPGGPQVIIGGHSAAAHRRAVTRGHGWFGFMLDIDATATQLDSLRRCAADHERPGDLGPLEITVTPRGRMDRERMSAYAALGVDRLAMMPHHRMPASDLDHFLQTHADMAGLRA